MGVEMAQELGLTWTELWLVVLTALAIYVTILALSRVFGQRQFATTSAYDLAFIFAIGSVAGRVILVRTSLLAAVVGLFTMFILHAATGWLHHHVHVVHRIVENRPVLLVAHGEVLDGQLERGRTSEVEVFEALRLTGASALDDVAAAVLERNGDISVMRRGQPLDVAVFAGVDGREHLARSDGEARPV